MANVEPDREFAARAVGLIIRAMEEHWPSDEVPLVFQFIAPLLADWPGMHDLLLSMANAVAEQCDMSLPEVLDMARIRIVLERR